MKRNNTAIAIIVLVGVLAALILISSFFLHVGPFANDRRGPVIATVDGQAIYLADARSRVNGLTTAHGGPVDALSSDQVLESLVADVIVREEAEQRNLTMTDQEVAKELLRIRGLFSLRSEYDSWLQSQGMDEAELERRIELQTVTARVYEAITADVVVSDADVRSYYNGHQDEFTEGGTVASLESVRDQIRQAILSQKQGDAYAAWMKTRRTEIDVVVLMKDWWRRIEDE